MNQVKKIWGNGWYFYYLLHVLLIIYTLIQLSSWLFLSGAINFYFKLLPSFTIELDNLFLPDEETEAESVDLLSTSLFCF